MLSKLYKNFIKINGQKKQFTEYVKIKNSKHILALAIIRKQCQ